MTMTTALPASLPSPCQLLACLYYGRACRTTGSAVVLGDGVGTPLAVRASMFRHLPKRPCECTA